MWSYVGSKDDPRWLWHAIDHESGKVLAYVFGNHKDAVFMQLKARLERFGITRFIPMSGARMHVTYLLRSTLLVNGIPKKIERKHLTLRTRIKRVVRKTIGFSKLKKMHDIVIGLLINRYEFGVLV